MSIYARGTLIPVINTLSLLPSGQVPSRKAQVFLHWDTRRVHSVLLWSHRAESNSFTMPAVRPFWIAAHAAIAPRSEQVNTDVLPFSAPECYICPRDMTAQMFIIAFKCLMYAAAIVLASHSALRVFERKDN